MTVISLDKIVKNILLRRKYPFHYYMEFLLYAKEGLREIAMDIDIIAGRYKCLPINDNFAIELPGDYLDYTRVSVRIDQYVHPLVEDDSLQLVPNYDSTFTISPYSSGVEQPSDEDSDLAGYSAPFFWGVNINNWGENIGRAFGGVGAMGDTFRVNKARNEIKLNENMRGLITEVVLEYASDGMDADSATHIDAYAEAAIKAFAMWQFKENNRTYSPSEAELAKREYTTQASILRARVSDLTCDRLKRIVQRNAIAIKY